MVSIQNSAFDQCSLLTGISFPSSLTAIGDSAFLGCSGLTELMLPENLTSIDGFAFRSCYNLTVISLPASLQSVGYKAFLYCQSVLDRYYGGDEAAWTALHVDLPAQRKHYNASDPESH